MRRLYEFGLVKQPESQMRRLKEFELVVQSVPPKKIRRRP